MTRHFDAKEWVPAVRTYIDKTPPRLDVYINVLYQEGWYTADWEQDNPGLSGGGFGWKIPASMRGRIFQQVALSRLLYGRGK